MFRVEKLGVTSAWRPGKRTDAEEEEEEAERKRQKDKRKLVIYKLVLSTSQKNSTPRKSCSYLHLPCALVPRPYTPQSPIPIQNMWLLVKLHQKLPRLPPVRRSRSRSSTRGCFHNTVISSRFSLRSSPTPPYPRSTMSTPHPIRAGVGRSRSDVGVSVREDDGPAPPPAGATDTEPMPAVFFRPAMSQVKRGGEGERGRRGQGVVDDGSSSSRCGPRYDHRVGGFAIRDVHPLWQRIVGTSGEDDRRAGREGEKRHGAGQVSQRDSM